MILEIIKKKVRKKIERKLKIKKIKLMKYFYMLF